MGRLQGAIKYTLESDLLFPSGSWEISDEGKAIIAKLASQLASTQRRKLMVNGYADNAPVGRGLRDAGVASNDVPSQKRAETAMRYMITQGVRPNPIAAKGRGESDPVATNNTSQGRAQNRRVEIAITPEA